MSKKIERVPHEYLLKEDYYETNNIGTRARGDYYCGQCGKVIPKGEPHENHKFYPEFEGVRTHSDCSESFLDSLRTEDEQETDE